MLRCPAVVVVVLVAVVVVVAMVVVAIWNRPVSVINPSWGRSSGRIKTAPKSVLPDPDLASTLAPSNNQTRGGF